MMTVGSSKYRMILALLTVAAAAMVASACPVGAAGTSPLNAQPPIAVPRTPGWFDYMVVDSKMRRLLLAHPGNQQFTVVDMDGGAVLEQVDVGDSRGVAVDERDGKYFVGTADGKVVDVNRKNMVLQSNIAMPGPIDAIAFDPKNDTLYADEDNGTHVWAISGKTDKIVASITIPMGPEYVDYDPVSNRIYQNIKPDPSMLLAIDPKTNTISARWPLAPATRVHGLAIDGGTQRLFSIGINGKLAVVDLKTGTLLTTVDVAERVDQIAVDQKSTRLNSSHM